MNLYLDIAGGISGDMFLATLLGLGVDEEHFRQEMKKLSIRDEFDIQIYPMKKGSIEGLKADVLLKDHQREHSHHHTHQEHGEHHHHHHRNFEDIKAIIQSSEISERAKEWALSVFLELAKAEAKVHGTTVEQVHFHEVGAVDSIVDIVGGCVLIDLLDIDQIYYNSLPMGAGQVQTEHGLMPIPAPATLLLMESMTTRMTPPYGEMVTPTGAALLRGLGAKAMPFGNMCIRKTSIGCGQKDFEIPNILRGILFDWDDSEDGWIKEPLLVLSCNLDDMTGEMMADAVDALMEAGAFDAWSQPIIMKKGRPAYMLQALIDAQSRKKMTEIFFERTTTLGVRCAPVERTALRRTEEQMQTPWGEVRTKVVHRPGGIDYKMEFEDLKQIAYNKNISTLRVQRVLERRQSDKDDEARD